MTNRLNFFNKKIDFLTLGEALEITGSSLIFDEDLQVKIFDVGTLQNANQDEISFLNSNQYLQKCKESLAGFCLIDAKNADKIADEKQGMIFLVCDNPYFAYSQIAAAFYEEKFPDFSRDLIHPSAQIGQGSIVAPSAYIGANVVIGKNCVIYPGAFIYQGCEIGDNCVINSAAVVSFAKIGNNCKIYSGTKIGQDGFGFAHNKGVNHKIIQLGIVEIGDDVEIGANSCIDRGAIENTIIGDGVKIDNLVQIAHNVEIGKGSVIAGCSAVAGSAKIGKFVQIGGNSAISGHIELGDGAKIAGGSGVMRDVAPMQTVGGFPALPIMQWHKINAKLIRMVNSKNSKD